VTLAMAAVSFAWALVIGFAIPPLEFYTLQGLMTVVFGSVAVFYILVRPDPQIARLMLNLVIGFWFVGFGILFSYLCATTNRPLVDTELAAIDYALGFDWPGMVNWAARQQWMVDWARFVYDRPFSELLIIFPALAIIGRPERVEEFVSCFIVSGIITAIIGAMLPADSGYAYFQVPPEVFMPLKAVVTPDYLSQFHELRSGELRHLVAGDVRGLVAFPSYHTAFALLLIYAVRNVRFLFYPSLILNGAVIATTPFVGAHYVTDVIGGFAVAAFAMWAVRPLQREKAPAAVSRAKDIAEPASA